MKVLTDLERMRLRHLGYTRVLIVEILLISFLPIYIFIPWLLSLTLVLLCLVTLVFVSRFSLLRGPENKIYYWLGCSAIFTELTWRLAFLIGDPLGRLLSPIHLITWLCFIGITEYRMVRVLSREPSATTRVVMGAVAGYLLIGIGGGILLNAVWVLHPQAFDLIAMEPTIDKTVLSYRFAPALMASSFAMLSTLGANIFTADLTGRVAGVTIPIVGQLYIVILIGLILGRYNQRSS